MTLRAIALHNSISKLRLSELYGSEWAQVFAGANATACRVCGTPFALWFADRNDPERPAFTQTLKARIAQDCENGAHPLREIQLDTTP